MQKTFQYKTATVSYRVEGKGQPVVLLHGFGEDGNVWNEQIAYLQAYCQLIIPDIPGSGQSALLDNEAAINAEQGISISDYAHCIQALLQHEQVNQCTMLGHSMGGYITLAFAGLFPQQLTAFGLVHSTAFADNEEKKANRLRGIDMMHQYGVHAFLKSTIPNLFSKKFKEEHPEKVTALIEDSKQFTVAACEQYYRAMMNRPDRTFVLKDNLLPVLFVIGTEDVAAPMKDVLQQVYLPKNSYIHLLDNVGHMGMWEASAAVNKHLHTFICRE